VDEVVRAAVVVVEVLGGLPQRLLAGGHSAALSGAPDEGCADALLVGVISASAGAVCDTEAISTEARGIVRANGDSGRSGACGGGEGGCGARPLTIFASSGGALPKSVSPMSLSLL